jgi:hypothetical protein
MQGPTCSSGSCHLVPSKPAVAVDEGRGQSAAADQVLVSERAGHRAFLPSNGYKNKPASLAVVSIGTAYGGTGMQAARPTLAI